LPDISSCSRNTSCPRKVFAIIPSPLHKVLAIITDNSL
jgi:hypothetical protein